MVSALVPCYGDLHVVTRSLPRLLERTASDLEVVLVNNDRRQVDGLRELVASMEDARVRVLDLEHSAGFIRAINAGIDATKGGLVFLANSDLFVGDGYVDQLVGFFDGNPRAGCATGKVLRYDVARNQETGVIDTAGHAIGRDRGATDRGENEVDAGQYEREEQVFGVSAAALVARREALESVRVAGEYLDESFFMYKEDVDLSWRVRLAGWECWYVPSAVAYHARTSRAPRLESGRSPFRSFHENEKRKPRHVRTNSMKNQWLMLVKNEDASNFARDFPFVLGRELLVLAYNGLFAPRITATAIRQFFAALPRARASRREIKAHQEVSPRDIRAWFRARSQASTVVRGERQPE